MFTENVEFLCTNIHKLQRSVPACQESRDHLCIRKILLPQRFCRWDRRVISRHFWKRARRDKSCAGEENKKRTWTGSPAGASIDRLRFSRRTLDEDLANMRVADNKPPVVKANIIKAWRRGHNIPWTRTHTARGADAEARRMIYTHGEKKGAFCRSEIWRLTYIVMSFWTARWADSEPAPVLPRGWTSIKHKAILINN